MIMPTGITCQPVSEPMVLRVLIKITAGDNFGRLEHRGELVKKVLCKT